VSTTAAYFSLIETEMIRNGVDADPLADELLAALTRGPSSNAYNQLVLQQHSPTASPAARPASWHRPDGSPGLRQAESLPQTWIHA